MPTTATVMSAALATFSKRRSSDGEATGFIDRCLSGGGGRGGVVRERHSVAGGGRRKRVSGEAARRADRGLDAGRACSLGAVLTGSEQAANRGGPIGWRAA